MTWPNTAVKVALPLASLNRPVPPVNTRVPLPSVTKLFAFRIWRLARRKFIGSEQAVTVGRAQGEASVPTLGAYRLLEEEGQGAEGRVSVTMGLDLELQALSPAIRHPRRRIGRCRERNREGRLKA